MEQLPRHRYFARFSNKAGLRLLGSFAGEAVAKAKPTGDDGWHIVKLSLETIESAAPALLGIGPEIDIIKPAALGVEIARLAQFVLQRMKIQSE